MTLTIFPRSAWGAVPPTYRRYLAPSQVNYAVIHYTAMKGTSTASIKAIQAFHMGPQRGWSDIAYNFVVLQNGNVYEGRGWNIAGGHALGFNTNSMAIVAVLGVGEQPSEAMKRSIREWRDYANQKYGKSLTTRGHRDLPNNYTDCPGELTGWVRAGLPVVNLPKPLPPTGNRFAGFPVIRRGSSGSAVTTLQNSLNRAFSSALVVDSAFGPLTETAVKRFQAAPLGGTLVVDGIVGPYTWAKLDLILDWQGR